MRSAAVQVLTSCAILVDLIGIGEKERESEDVTSSRAWRARSQHRRRGPSGVQPVKPGYPMRARTE